MSDCVRLTKDGLVAYEWDSETQTCVSEPVTRRVLLRLRLRCLINEGVTLGDIFRAVSAFPDLVAFISQYSWCSVQEFHDQALLPRAEGDEQLRHIEIARYIDITDRDCSEYLDVTAVREPAEPGQGHYAIDFSPMNELAHLAVKLKPMLEIRKDGEKLSEHPCIYTLLDVLDAIYDEISFHGGPEETAAAAQEMNDLEADVDAGRAELIPLEDVLKEQTRLQ